MTRLGTTFSSEEHGEQLTAVLDSDRQLSVFAFADWYIRWLYKSDGSDAGDDEEAEQQSSATSGSQGWFNVKWSVAPVTRQTPTVVIASVLLSATRYAQELGLDEDEAEDVQSEIDNARQAWSAVVTGDSDKTTVDKAIPFTVRHLSLLSRIGPESRSRLYVT